jgi:hypothetical protein
LVLGGSLDVGAWYLELLLLLRVPNISLAVAEPAARRHLLLREELNAFTALLMQIAEE